ncbi:GerAB/ArcD/ProY family transporter [Paenibacillus andongensis]|uniref:GerAB/ArcD/ProY family transporter n=1 Tax=Paenibacillus andongensis TaxID=2975482 RepID=UPI0021BA736D|nr:spore germination protein [Paenibacillus andongensis]
MQVSEKITGTQLGLLMFTSVVSTIILSVPGTMVALAKQNAWLSVFPAMLTGVLSIWLMTTLADRYPGLTIVQYSSKIVGKWPGKLLGLYYTYYLFFYNSVNLQQHAQFMNTVLMPTTPPLIIILGLALLSSLAVFTGIEVIGRCNELLTPLIIIFLIPLFIIAIGDSDPGQLKPVLNEGVLPIFQGAVVPSGWMNQFFFLGWLLPYLNQPQKARKISLIMLLSIAALILVIDLLTIMVFGSIAGNMSFPFLRVIQYIGISGSFERLESLAVALWVIGIFIKGSVLLFMFCLTISQLFGISNSREIISPVTVLSVVGSIWIFKSSAEFQDWMKFTFPIMAFFTHNLVPLALLSVDIVKSKFSRSLL